MTCLDVCRWRIVESSGEKRSRRNVSGCCSCDDGGAFRRHPFFLLDDKRDGRVLFFFFQRTGGGSGLSCQSPQPPPDSLCSLVCSRRGAGTPTLAVPPHPCVRPRRKTPQFDHLSVICVFELLFFSLFFNSKKNPMILPEAPPPRCVESKRGGVLPSPRLSSSLSQGGKLCRRTRVPLW